MATDANVSSGGALIVSSGGVADPTTIFRGGTETIGAGGTDDGARISGGGKLFIQSGGTALDITIFSGGSAINSAGGTLDAVASLTDSGMLTNLGTINVEQGGTLTLAAVTISNAGAIALSGDAQATLLVESAVILAGGGKVALGGDGNNVISGSSTATLTNAGNTISGAGDIFGLNLVNSGTVNANNPGQTLFVDAARIVNAGLLEDTAAGGLFFQGTPTISNTAKGVILASGTGANVALAGVAVYGGTLKTSAAGDIAFVGAGNVLSGATIATCSLVEVAGSCVGLTGGKIGAGATLETLNGGVIDGKGRSKIPARCLRAAPAARWRSTA